MVGLGLNALHSEDWMCLITWGHCILESPIVVLNKYKSSTMSDTFLAKSLSSRNPQLLSTHSAVIRYSFSAAAYH